MSRVVDAKGVGLRKVSTVLLLFLSQLGTGHSSCWDTAKHDGNVAKYSHATGPSSVLYLVLEEY